MRIRLGIVVSAFALLVVAAPASAAVRYAEPGGDGPVTSCPESNPCDIEDAVEDLSVTDGDEVIVLPGTYDLGAGDFDAVSVNDRIELHGAVGRPRPVITSAFDATLALNFDGGARVHDLIVEHTGDSGRALDATFSEAVIERVVARSTAEFGSGCAPPREPGLIRDSVCFSTGTGLGGIHLALGMAGDVDYQLRNVTAIGTGANSFGLRFSGDSSTFDVDARNVIADGVLVDVTANASSTATVAITLDHSNYATTSETGAGTASVTPAGSGTNQSEPPELRDPANGNVRQLRGSPTINAGAEVPLLGELDFERQPRTQGAAIDIGADEFDRRLKLKVKAKKKQKPNKLKVKVRCPEEECYVKASGRAEAGGERFKLKKTKKRFLNPGQKKKLKLKAKNVDELKQLLGGGEGEAKIKIKGTDAGGVKAKKKLTVKLVG
jgi:hypothetical protein